MSPATHTQVIAFREHDAAGVLHQREVKVTVYVDMAEIARTLGQRAAKNKAGRARFMHGAVIVERHP